MKKATITITFEQEKLNAIQFYAGKKDASLTTELNDYMEKLNRPARPATQTVAATSQE